MTEYTATRDLVISPHRMVVVEYESGLIQVDVAPLKVDLLEGREAAPLRERLAGFCYVLNIMGSCEDPWFVDGVCERLGIVLMNRCHPTIRHHCAVQALEDSWRL